MGRIASGSWSNIRIRGGDFNDCFLYVFEKLEMEELELWSV